MLMQDPSLEKEECEKDFDNCDNYTNNDENCYVDYNNNVGGVPLQENENRVPYAVASVNEPHSAPGTAGYHYGGGMACAPHVHVMAGRAQHAPTATVEGVLVVAAAPAPAVLASRPYPTNEMCGVGVVKQNGGGMFKGGPGVPAGQGRATKSTRYERVSFSRE